MIASNTFTMKGIGQVVVSCVALFTMSIAEAVCPVEQQEVVLELNVGMQPNQVGYSLGCDELGEVWTIPIGSVSTGAELWLKETACVSSIDTCSLELTLGESNEETFFVYSRGADTIGYSGENQEASSTFCSGPNCDKMTLEIQDVQDGDDYYDDDADAMPSIERGDDSSKQTDETPFLRRGICGVVVACICIIIIAARNIKRRQKASNDEMTAVTNEYKADITCSAHAIDPLFNSNGSSY